MQAITRRLADFVRETQFEALPTDVRHEAARALLNFVGCALGGSRDPACEIAFSLADEYAGPRTATVIGRGARLDPPGATQVNALAAAVTVFDETHLETVIHPVGMVASAVLALAEQHRVSGADALTAMVVGIETECRLARMLMGSGAQGEVGWYLSSVVGAAGAAAGCARLLGLDARHTRWALGIGALHGAGFRQAHANMCVGLMPASAARNGLTAALLAGRGFTCSDEVLEGANGFAQMFARVADPDAVTDCLGEDWEIRRIAYKPYPCGIVIHPVIDACLDMARSRNIDADEVRRIRLRVHPLCVTLCDRPHPGTALDAQVSVQHWAAAALIHGAAGIREGSEACIRDHAVRGLRERVEVNSDESISRDGALVAVELADGVVLERRIKHCVGSHDRPMSDAELDDKFLRQAVPVVGEAGARNAIAACRGLAEADRVTDVTSAASA